MKSKILYLVVLTALVLSACGGKTTATKAPPTTAPEDEPTKAPATSAPIVNPAGCTDTAAFVADVTVPDNTNFDPGETFNKVWRVENTGTCTWTEEYTMVFASGEQMGAPDSVPLEATKPGETLDIAVDMTAPGEDAVFRADFELHNPDGETMPIDQNTVLWVIITVGTATADSSDSSSTNTDSGGPGFAAVSCAFTTSQANVDAVVAAINALRAQNNLPALTVSAELTAAAQAHSNDMACNNLFVHNGSNGSTPQSRAAAAGYTGSVTENVYGRNPVPTGQEAVTWWATDQTDPRHRENLLTTKYTEIGVGYSFFNSFGYYAVVFGAP
ncbi:MAG: CAP domain-containing protein [Chloroflexota bacterium]